VILDGPYLEAEGFEEELAVELARDSRGTVQFGSRNWVYRRAKLAAGESCAERNFLPQELLTESLYEGLALRLGFG